MVLDNRQILKEKNAKDKQSGNERVGASIRHDEKLPSTPLQTRRLCRCGEYGLRRFTSLGMTTLKAIQASLPDRGGGGV